MSNPADLYSLKRVDPVASAREARQWQGQAALAAMPRLMAELDNRVPAGELAWSAALRQRRGAEGTAVVWMDLSVRARVSLTCQRCLEPVEVTLDAGRAFRFVATEAQALAEDDDSDEDLLSLEQPLDLPVLIEDELLMALPLVPRHDRCPTPPPLSAADPEALLTPEKANPFAALVALRKKP